jgi:hypothetical protein
MDDPPRIDEPAELRGPGNEQSRKRCLSLRFVALRIQ